jgi:hypothetical protein
MKKSVKKLHLHRETVQRLVADHHELRGVAAGDNSAGMICSRLMIWYAKLRALLPVAP